MTVKEKHINLDEHPEHLVDGAPPPLLLFTEEQVPKYHYNGLVVQGNLVTHRVKPYNDAITGGGRIHIDIGGTPHTLTPNNIGTVKDPQYPTIEQYLTVANLHALPDIGATKEDIKRGAIRAITQIVNENFPAKTLREVEENEAVVDKIVRQVTPEPRIILGDKQSIDLLNSLDWKSVTTDTRVDHNMLSRRCWSQIASAMKKCEEDYHEAFIEAMGSMPDDPITKELGSVTECMHKGVEKKLATLHSAIRQSIGRPSPEEGPPLAPPSSKRSP